MEVDLIFSKHCGARKELAGSPLKLMENEEEC